jgi:lipopolysaccharide/colanic/teichoic acid biosynthesis glycosyltransferase
MEDAHEAYRKLIQPRKLELQKEYVLKSSLLLDIKIVLNTLKAVIGGK